MKTTLYWHDYETSGINPALDRPLQFAGVRTDEDLNVIGEPLMLYCLPPKDRLPHPQACLVTGIAPQQLLETGLPEPEFIKQIHGELSRPGTCGVGYNSIRFDDEVTRFTLYRNFYDPYQREWQHGNSRWDIIDMLRLTRALRPQGIVWPDHEDGSPSFRLEDLAAANNLEHGAAHDALSDVYATIALARLVKSRQPRLYDYVYAHRSKRQVASLIDLRQRKPFLHVSSRLPRAHGYTGIMMPLCQHPTNSNAIIAVDLSADPRPLIELDGAAIRERLFTAQAELPEGVARIPLKGVHLNRCPVVATPRLLDKQASTRLGIDSDQWQRHWRELSSHDLAPKLREVFSYGDTEASVDAEAALYHGFLSDAERPLLELARNTAPDRLAAIEEQFTDARYRELAFRHRARYALASLSADELARWHDLRAKWLTGGQAGLLDIAAYNGQISALEHAESTTDRQRSLLRSLREWGQMLVQEC